MNQLQSATSPYLLQHVDNPVEWHEWGEAALALAREQEKPILLSIGYSACHWCHVMAHESFEDPATAAVMNSLFVNIKVDREERPDLDKIYQLAHQVLTRQNGGWPLTMFLTPDDHLPFFGGTYFPPDPRHGLPGFVDLLKRVRVAWDDRRDDVRAQNESMQDFLSNVAQSQSGQPGTAVLAQVVTAAAGQFDNEHGGLGSSPKFPNPPILRLLLRQTEAGDQRAKDMALKTLEKMALGGINDQLAGGFCRYAVDQYWMIPHFEKMLYDNAQLLTLYAEAALIDDNPLWSDTARATGRWMIRDLQSADGGFWSSFDADSEGEEGKFYVWQLSQLADLLSDDEYALAELLWGVNQPANFEGEAWHLHVFTPLEQVAEQLGLSAADALERLESIKSKLMQARQQRVPPGLDDKVLTSWNGLAIAGLAKSGRLLGEPSFIDAAHSALDYLRSQHWHDGRLLATSKDGRAHLNAYLDDHAFLLMAAIECLQARWRESDLQFARALADSLLEKFEDEQEGGFFYTSHDHEQLIQRPKPVQDDAIPAGGAIAIEGLLALGHLLGHLPYLQAAERAIKTSWGDVERSPLGYCSAVLAAQDWLEPPAQLIVRGDAVDRPSDLRSRLFVAPVGDSAVLDQHYPGRGEFTAYQCRGTQCDAPIESRADWDRTTSQT